MCDILVASSGVLAKWGPEKGRPQQESRIQSWAALLPTVLPSAPAIPFHWPGPSGLVLLRSILIVAWAGRLGRVWLGGWGSLPQTGGWEEACPDTEPLCLPDQQGSWCGISGRFFSPLSFFFFYLRRIIALSRGSQDSKSLCRTAGQPRDVPLDQPQLPSPFPPARSLGRASL